MFDVVFSETLNFFTTDLFGGCSRPESEFVPENHHNVAWVVVAKATTKEEVVNSTLLWKFQQSE